jgi:hypothetical protein
MNRSRVRFPQAARQHHPRSMAWGVSVAGTVVLSMCAPGARAFTRSESARRRPNRDAAHIASECCSRCDQPVPVLSLAMRWRVPNKHRVHITVGPGLSVVGGSSHAKWLIAVPAAEASPSMEARTRAHPPAFFVSARGRTVCAE